MTRLRNLLLATLAMTGVAHAEVTDYGMSRMTIEEPGRDHCVADLRINDRIGVYNEVETHATSIGPVVAEYTTEGGQGEPDFVEVLSTPEGTVAVPPRLQLESGDQNLICIMKWTGA